MKTEVRDQRPETKDQGKAQRFIVKFGKYPIHFHKNLAGKVYRICKDEDATRFESEAKAMEAIREHRVPRHYAEVVAV